jgi:nucleotide-binding universal stress UspA family protein
MLTLDRILVPTDFSEGASAAYAYANALASKYGGKIDFLHVIPSFRYLNESISRLGLPIDMDKDIYPPLLRETQDRLRREMDRVIPAENRGDAIVKVDFKASECIAHQAETRHADVVVMGSIGAGNHHLFSGSTTESVIRRCTVPVLSIPLDSVPGDVNHILVPTDYSDNSFHALRGAISMADSLHAEITVLHVVELYGSLSENEPRDAGRDELDAITDKLADRMQAWMNRNPSYGLSMLHEGGQTYLVLRKGVNERRVPIRTVVTKGLAAHHDIIDFANGQADMVVMTTHGRSGLNHLFLGSTTERVVHATHIPALTWRPVNTG